ncbi:bifunctional riboflavin kinase/FMN phosphatase [Tanacetum coccineum]
MGEKLLRLLGKRLWKQAAAIVDDYSLPLSKEDLLSEISMMFSDHTTGCPPLINHLRGHGVKMALASNSLRDSIETKISYYSESFSVIIGGDEVKEGKPSPKIFLEAAKRPSVDPSKCLVIEDSVSVSRKN